MIFTIQSDEPLVMVPERRYMQLLETETQSAIQLKEKEDFIREFVVAFRNAFVNDPNVLKKPMSSIEMPNFEIIYYPLHKYDKIEWRKKNK